MNIYDNFPVKYYICVFNESYRENSGFE